MLCVLAGCIKIDYALEVNEDDTLSGDFLFAMDRKVLTMDGKSDREVLAEMQRSTDQDNSELPGVTRVEPYRKDGYLGQRVYFEDVPFEKFMSEQEDMEMRLDHVGDEYRFDATVEPAKSSSDLKELSEAVTASMRVELSISFPGDISETNGKLVDDRTAKWTLDVQRRSRLRAVASDAPPSGILGAVGSGDQASGSGGAGSDDGSRWLWYGLAGVLVLAVAGGITGGLLERRRR